MFRLILAASLVSFLFAGVPAYAGGHAAASHHASKTANDHDADDE